MRAFYITAAAKREVILMNTTIQSKESTQVMNHNVTHQLAEYHLR